MRIKHDYDDHGMEDAVEAAEPQCHNWQQHGVAEAAEQHGTSEQPDDGYEYSGSGNGDDEEVFLSEDEDEDEEAASGGVEQQGRGAGPPAGGVRDAANDDTAAAPSPRRRRGGGRRRPPGGPVHSCFYCGGEGSLSELAGCCSCNYATFEPHCAKRAHLSCAANLPGVLLPGFKDLGLWFCGRGRKDNSRHTASYFLTAVHGPSNTARRLREFLTMRAAVKQQLAAGSSGGGTAGGSRDGSDGAAPPCAGEFFNAGKRITKLARGLLPDPAKPCHFTFAGMLPADAGPAARDAPTAAAADFNGTGGRAAVGPSSPAAKRPHSLPGTELPAARAQLQPLMAGQADVQAQQSPGAKRPRRRAAAVAACAIQENMRSEMRPEVVCPIDLLPARPPAGAAAGRRARSSSSIAPAATVTTAAAAAAPQTPVARACPGGTDGGSGGEGPGVGLQAPVPRGGPAQHLHCCMSNMPPTGPVAAAGALPPSPAQPEAAPVSHPRQVVTEARPAAVMDGATAEAQPGAGRASAAPPFVAPGDDGRGGGDAAAAVAAERRRADDAVREVVALRQELAAARAEGVQSLAEATVDHRQVMEALRSQLAAAERVAAEKQLDAERERSGRMRAEAMAQAQAEVAKEERERLQGELREERKRANAAAEAAAEQRGRMAAQQMGGAGGGAKS